MEEYI